MSKTREILETAQRLQDRGELDRAAATYRQALALEPASAPAHFGLGVILQTQGQVELAIESYRRAIDCREDFADAHNNLGTLYKRLGQCQQALDCYAKALEFKPNFLEALNNLGNVLKLQGRLDEAEVCYNQVLSIADGHLHARYNRSLVRLAAGDLLSAWPDFEVRFECGPTRERSFPKPRWHGEPLADGTLLVHAEQDLGDTILFCRYAILLAAAGQRIVFEVPPELVPLFRQSGFGRRMTLVARGSELPPFDVHVPLLSLAGICGTSLEAIPSLGAYLSADPRLVRVWRTQLHSPSFKIGIAWQGDDRAGGVPRALSLAHLAALARPGVEFVALQPIDDAQRAGLAGRMDLRDVFTSFDRRRGPFLELAAVLKCLDLVVCGDGFVAHLAGALGVPTWLALSAAPDWKWLTDREDSPWYPSLRLFRQRKLDDWDELVARVAGELENLATRGGR